MMNSNSNLPNNAASIHKLLEEIHTSLADLEAQLKLGLLPSQPEEVVEVAMPEDQSPIWEDGTFWADWF
jgi:hypothetical protein